MASGNVGIQQGEWQVEHRQVDLLEMRAVALELLTEADAGAIPFGDGLGSRGVGDLEHDGVDAVTLAVEELGNRRGHRGARSGKWADQFDSVSPVQVDP